MCCRRLTSPAAVNLRVDPNVDATAKERTGGYHNRARAKSSSLESFDTNGATAAIREQQPSDGAL
jgi:hypothetical protein